MSRHEGRTGHHTDVVSKGLRIGMALFITSEVLFFFAFFWAFFWGALYPPDTVGVSWPPEDVEPVATWSIPFLNTLILLLSGATVTWAHHAIREGDHYVVNGHKIWQGMAHHADWMFTLVRTDPAARRAQAALRTGQT